MWCVDMHFICEWILKSLKIHGYTLLKGKEGGWVTMRGGVGDCERRGE